MSSTRAVRFCLAAVPALRDHDTEVALAPRTAQNRSGETVRSRPSAVTMSSEHT